MMSPTAMAMAAMTVMLWILWSDSVRAKRPSQILYTMRIALFLMMSAILVLNLVRYPRLFSGGARLVVVLTVIVGVFGAGYFARRLVRRS
jgi:hypothetical protein